MEPETRSTRPRQRPGEYRRRPLGRLRVHRCDPRVARSSDHPAQLRVRCAGSNLRIESEPVHRANGGVCV